MNFCFSSLKAEEKRGGSGSHNWGTVKDELRSVPQQGVTPVSRMLVNIYCILRLLCVFKNKWILTSEVTYQYIGFPADLMSSVLTASLTSQTSQMSPMKERSIHLLTLRTSMFTFCISWIYNVHHIAPPPPKNATRFFSIHRCSCNVTPRKAWCYSIPV